MKLINKIIIKYLACSYYLYCSSDNTPFLSFEEYCNKFNYYLKNHKNSIDVISNLALKSMKKTKIK